MKTRDIRKSPPRLGTSAAPLRSARMCVLLLCVSFLLPGLSGCFLVSEEKDRLAPPLVEAPEVQYDVKEVKRRPLFVNSIRIAGSLAPVRKQELYFKAGGRVDRLFISREDFYLRKGNVPVRKGDILAELDSGNLASQVQRQALQLEKTQNTYELKKTLGANVYELRNAAIDVRLAELLLEELQDSLARRRLVAPFSGVVTLFDAEEGEYVEPYAPVMVVIDPTEIVLECTGDAVRRFRTGMEATVTYQGEDYRGRVIASTEDSPDSSVFEEKEMIVDVERLPADAAIGDTATIGLVLERAEEAIVLRKDAIYQYAGRSYVNVLKDGLKEEREVELGIETTVEVEIVSGLEEGELVIIR